MTDTIHSFSKEKNQTLKSDEQGLKKPVYFECGQCGECCSSWNIPIESEKAAYLLQQPWVQERLASFGRTLEPLPEQSGLYRIPLTSANTCVFLADDKRCLVEANESLSYKPHECRRFPFATVRLTTALPPHPAPSPARGEGILTSLSEEAPSSTSTIAYETSAACKHISEKLLLAFEPIQPKPSDRSAQLDENERLILSQCPSTVYIHGWEKATWPETEAWRQEIKAYFMDASLSPSQALWKAHQSLKQFDNRKSNHKKSSFPRKRESQGTMDESLGKRKLGRYKEAVNKKIKELFGIQHYLRAWKGKDSRLRGNDICVSLKDHSSSLLMDPRLRGDDVREKNWKLHPWKERLLVMAFLRKPYRTYSLVQLLMDKQYEDRRIFGVPISLQSRYHVHWDTNEDIRVKAYLYNLICRRVPLIHGQSLLSLWGMAVCAYVLVRWHAITLASLRVSELNHASSTSVCSDDVSSAIRLTERYYTGHQPRFMRWFCQRWQGELLAHCL